MRRDSSRRRLWSAAISSASVPCSGQGDVVGGGGVDHLLGVTAGDPGVLVVLGQDGGVAVAQPEAGGLLPGLAEPDRLGEPGVAEAGGEQGHAAPVLHGLQLPGVPGHDHLPVVRLGEGDQVGQVRAGHHRRLVDRQEGAWCDGHGGRARRAGRAGGRGTGRCCSDSIPPAARVLRADWDAVMPTTGPRPAAVQARAISARTRVLPDPAGALITDTRRPSVSTDSAAAAWSSRSPDPVALAAPRRRPRHRPARARAARGRRRARARRPRGSCAARPAPAPARPCVLPWSAARGWRSGSPPWRR